MVGLVPTIHVFEPSRRKRGISGKDRATRRRAGNLENKRKSKAFALLKCLMALF